MAKGVAIGLATIILVSLVVGLLAFTTYSPAIPVGISGSEKSSACPSNEFPTNETSAGNLVCTLLPPVGPYNDIINRTGSTYYAYTSQGRLVTSSTTFTNVLTTVVGSAKSIFMACGNYVITTGFSSSASNAHLWGGGSCTNITVSASFNAVPFTVTGHNWLIERIRMDCFGMTYGNSNAGLSMTGNNDTVTYSFFNRCDHGQINLGGTGDQALFNYVTNSNDDGIIGRVNGALIKGDIIEKTTHHNCVSMVGPSNEFQILDVICKNSGAEGVALENLGAGACVNGIIAHITIINPANIAVDVRAKSGSVASAYNDSFSYIVIYGPTGADAVSVHSGSGLDFSHFTITHSSGNAFEITNTVASQFNTNNIAYVTIGLDFGSGDSAIQANGNFINKTSSYAIHLGSAIPKFQMNDNWLWNCVTYCMFLQGSGFSANGNHITLTTSALNIIGIYASSAVNGTIENNVEIGDHSSNRCIYLPSAMQITVTGNFCQGWSIGISETGTGDYNTIALNNLKNQVTTPIAFVGVHDFVVLNEGYNPASITTVTAGASVWTYTNNDGYDEVMVLTTVGGISAETCDTIAGFPVISDSQCIIPPGRTMVVTWAVTAPVYTKVPLVA